MSFKIHEFMDFLTQAPAIVSGLYLQPVLGSVHSNFVFLILWLSILHFRQGDLHKHRAKWKMCDWGSEKRRFLICVCMCEVVD